MENGTKEDYEFLDEIEDRLHAEYVDRVLTWLQWNEGDTGYQISRFDTRFSRQPSRGTTTYTTSARTGMLVTCSRITSGTPTRSSSAPTTNCFDPEYENRPLEFFEPMVRRVFSAQKHETL